MSNKKYSGWIFTATFIAQALLYHYHEILFHRPYSTHQWRQCDGIFLLETIFSLKFGEDKKVFRYPNRQFISFVIVILLISGLMV